MLKFVVLSDLHVVPEQALSHGLDTHARLETAIAYVNDSHGDADFVVLNGDLADHGVRAAYERLAAALTELRVPYYMTLGNHDDRATFLEVFGADLAAETGCIDRVVAAKGYRVVILDTLDPEGDHVGRLSEAQLDWLSRQLAAAAAEPVVVVLHHNFAPLGVQTDFLTLSNRTALAAILRRHPDIRQVISGHAHMTTSGMFQGVPFCTLGGAHYAIDPVLETRSGPIPHLTPRREGPGQAAVVLCGPDSVVVHMENFIDRHLVLAPELFRWDRDEG